jgi:hypothetical protein
MVKLIARTFLTILTILVLLVFYISYFGFETNRFDSLIKNKANAINKNISLDFSSTKIHLKPTKLNIDVRLQNPKILIKNKEIKLSKLNLFLSIESFFNSNFLLKEAEVEFVRNDIKDLTKLTNIFLPRIINKQLNKVFEKGSLEGKFSLPFDKNGNLQKKYKFSGKILNASINITKDYSFQNLTTEVNYEKNSGIDKLNAIVKNGSLYNINLADSKLDIIKNENQTKVKSILYTNGIMNYNQIKNIYKLFGLKLNFLKDINLNVNLETKINFDLNQKYKIKNLVYSSEGNIKSLELNTTNNNNIKKYLPNYNDKIYLKNTKIEFKKSKTQQIVLLKGLIKSDGNYDNFKLSQEYIYKEKSHKVKGEIELKNSEVIFPNLNYKKKIGIKSDLLFDIFLLKGKSYNINNLQFISNKNKIFISDLKLNKDLEIINFKNFEIKTFLNETKNNDFFIKKSDKIIVSGDIFDAQPLLKSLFKNNNKNTFSNNFKSEIKVNFEKALTGTNDNIIDFAMIAKVDNGSFQKLSLKGNFSDNEIIEISIYKLDQDTKTLQVISDRARPLIKHFDFIKGFEGGKLQYETIFTKEGSKSNLVINDFKVSEVPALAQLLTLASLQGIADTLSGEGIRFESFEMRLNSKDNILNIEDALAMGPAVSILLDGYVDKGKIVSLRGTLVPATKLNAFIAKIPLVGDILVGKKTGEGVVGVSFKMKGPPKNIKTTVNPIKTLTPRFIVRAVENMKKKRKEEAK